MRDLLLTVIWNFLILFQRTEGSHMIRACRYDFIDCKEQKIQIIGQPYAHALADVCQNRKACHDVKRCKPEQNCTSSLLLDNFYEDCNCKSKCVVRIGQREGFKNCFYFDMEYKCVDECGLSSAAVTAIVVVVVLLILLITGIIIFCLIRRKRKRRAERRTSGFIQPEHLQRAYKVHQKRNDQLSKSSRSKDTNKNICLTDIRQINAQCQDAATPDSETGHMGGSHDRAKILGRQNGTGGQQGTPAGSIASSLNSHVTGSKIQPAGSESGSLQSKDTEHSSEKAKEFVLVDNDDFKIYVKNEPSENDSQFPGTKLNKNYDNVKIGSNNAQDNEVPEEDCGDYDNMQFCNAPTSNEQSPTWHAQQDETYDNMMFIDQTGEIVSNERMNSPDFGLNYDNVMYEGNHGEMMAPQYPQGVEYAQDPECAEGYDNVEFCGGHGDIAENKISVIADRDLPVIYEYDEGISMEGDVYDNVEFGASLNPGQKVQIAHQEGYAVPGMPGVSMHKGVYTNSTVTQYDPEEIVLSAGSGLHSGEAQGAAHHDPRLVELLNRINLTDQGECSPDAHDASVKGNLYHSLQASLLASNFQKPTDYGMKENDLYSPAPDHNLFQSDEYY